MPNDAWRIMWDKILLSAILAILGAALWQIFANTNRISTIEQQIISIHDLQTRQEFLHQREMDRMARDIEQHRQATEKH